MANHAEIYRLEERRVVFGGRKGTKSQYFERETTNIQITLSVRTLLPHKVLSLVKATPAAWHYHHGFGTLLPGKTEGWPWPILSTRHQKPSHRISIFMVP